MAAYWNRKQVTPGEVAYAGVIAGILAGIAMAIVSMGWAMMTGRGAWTPVKMIAVTVLNRSWLDRPGFQFTPVMVGMMIHFATAIGFGIIFSLIGGRLSYGQAISWGISVWAGDLALYAISLVADCQSGHGADALSAVRD